MPTFRAIYSFPTVFSHRMPLPPRLATALVIAAAAYLVPPPDEVEARVVIVIDRRDMEMSGAANLSEPLSSRFEFNRVTCLAGLRVIGAGSATRGTDESSGSLSVDADLVSPLSRGNPLRTIRDLAQRDNQDECHGLGERPLRARLRADPSRNLRAEDAWSKARCPVRLPGLPDRDQPSSGSRCGPVPRFALPRSNSLMPDSKPFRPYGTSSRCSKNAPGIDPVVIDRAAPLFFLAWSSVRTFPRLRAITARSDPGKGSGILARSPGPRLVVTRAPSCAPGSRCTPPSSRTGPSDTADKRGRLSTGFCGGFQTAAGRCQAVPGCARMEHNGQGGSPRRQIESIVS